MATQVSVDFGATFPAGNAIRSKMKAIEKLSYLEIRFMNLLLDAHEARRRLIQEIQESQNFKKMKEVAIQICDEFVSARVRFRDQVKIEMSQVQGAWKEIAKDAIDSVLADGEEEIIKLKKGDGKAKEMASWQKWLQEVRKMKEIKWDSEIDRFKMV